MRTLSEEILEKSRGRRRRENFIENHRKAEKNRAKDKTLIYNGQLSGKVKFSFVNNQLMPRCLTYFVELAKKGPESVCNSVLTEILTYFNNHVS